MLAWGDGAKRHPDGCWAHGGKELLDLFVGEGCVIQEPLLVASIAARSIPRFREAFRTCRRVHPRELPRRPQQTPTNGYLAVSWPPASCQGLCSHENGGTGREANQSG